MARRVAGGDASAFRPIVEHTQAALYRLASRLCGNLSDAEDALQDAYVKAYRALTRGNYDGRSSVNTWLYRIVTNTCLDLRRKRREVLDDANHEPSFDGALTAEARLALRELDVWLGDLPEAQRTVVVLKSIEGMSTQEVAEILECSVGSVEQRLVRARATLRARAETPQVDEP